MALDNWGEALFRMVSAIVPMYVVMLFGVFASRWKVIDKPESKGLEKFLSTYVMPAISLKLMSQTDLLGLDHRLVAAVAMYLAFSLTIAAISAQVLKLLIMRTRTKPFSALKWTITLNSQITMNNGLTIGVPAMASMYGVQISEFAQISILLTISLSVPIVMALYETAGARSAAAAAAAASADSVADSMDQLAPSGAAEEKARASADAVSHTAVLVGEDAKDAVSTDTLHAMPPRTWRDSLVVQIILKIVQNKIIIASVLGFIYSAIAFSVDPNHVVPTLLDLCFSWFSNCMWGLSLFNVGYFMASVPLRVSRVMQLQLVMGTVLKFVASPILFFLAAWFAGMRGDQLKALVVQGMIPQATASFIFAQMYDVFPKFNATMLVLGNLMCFPVLVCGFFILEAIPYMQ